MRVRQGYRRAGYQVIKLWLSAEENSLVSTIYSSGPVDSVIIDRLIAFAAAWTALFLAFF